MADTQKFLQYINQKYNLKIKYFYFTFNNQKKPQLTNKQYIHLAVNCINLFFPKKERSITYTKTLAISIELFSFLLETQCHLMQETNFSISYFKKFGSLNNIYELLKEKSITFPDKITNFINDSQCKDNLDNNERLGYLVYLMCSYIDAVTLLEKEFLLFGEKEIEKQMLQISIPEGKKNHLVKI